MIVHRAAMLILGSMLLLAAGCGFKPVYGTASATHGAGVVQQFSAIEIAPLPNAIGLALRNKLIDALHPGGAAADYDYRLSATVREAVINLGLQANATSTRGQVRITAEYWLYDSKSDTVLVHETVRASTGYNILLNQFGTVLSADDARDRSLQQIADEMTRHLALYFTRP